jgi:hypothetical protein
VFGSSPGMNCNLGLSYLDCRLIVHVVSGVLAAFALVVMLGVT